jgi:hypothetical protein
MAQVQESRRAVKTHAHLSPQIQDCIEACLDCHRICLTMASQHCLIVGGEHVAPEHFRHMMACAEICRGAAAIMMIGIDQMNRVCAACAEICDACAESCAALDGMEECVRACRRCAAACRQMAG